MSDKYVIDTNVIMSDPFFAGKIDGEIVIPTTVLQELDNHKSDNGEVGRNVREFGRLFKADKDGVIYTTFNSTNSNNKDLITNDDKIIAVAIKLKAILVTGDNLMTAIARSMGVTTQEYSPEEYDGDEEFTGIASFDYAEDISLEDLYPNEYVLPTKGRLEKFNGTKLVKLQRDKEIWGITHKNVEQKCALDALLDDDIKLVTLSGRAGTGKTLLAVAAALERTVNENKFSKVLISRPIVAMGDDIGYLPGDVNEKLGPWMQPIFDNIDFLFNTRGKPSKDNYEDLVNTGILKIEALTYIRGRSIPQQYMIIDEAQNLTPHEVKTIITRAGEGTKIVLTGDPDQIDNKKCDSVNNGLSYVIEKFREYKIAAHITLTKGERSELADIAADIL